DENGVSNSSECSRKDKSLGIIQVALNLISDAKKTLPVCQKEPPTIVTTVQPLTNVTTIKPLTNVTTVEPLTNVTSVEPLTNATSVEPLTNATRIEPLTNATTVEPMPETTTEDIRPMDCQDLQAAGAVASGVYSVWLRGGKSSVRVQCDMDTDGGGWTVLQRRGNFSQLENFDRGWQDYKNGFGNLEMDFWLGNDIIFALTNQGNYSLRMDMTAADGGSAYALYQEFRIRDENANYRLHVKEYSGTAGTDLIRLCWVFVLVAVVVVVVPCDARPHKCEQRERSLADLDLAEDSLNRAKQLYPNCEEENESSNSSECSKKDKSLGFIDVALDLVSNAKKNIPLCPHIPTEEPLTPTELPVTTTEEPTPEVTTEDFLPMDCQDLLAAGHVTSGVYSVWLRGGKSAVPVRCDMDTDGGGWTVIQRRGNFIRQEDFNRNWQDYKHGFGSLERDFWLGNNNIFALTNQGNYSLRMDMTAADNKSAYELYQEFRIEDENVNYRLHVKGTTGGKMGNFGNEMFTTKDRKNNRMNTENCAEERKGGFWYYYCDADSNPNGLYNPGVEDNSSMYYWAFKKYSGLSSIDMKIKRM
ncbi:hypothetical protein JTE90_029272, partial [Oedothorax gibbosus]